MRLATKFYTSILAVIVLAMLSSSLAVVATWQMGRLIQELTGINLPDIREAEKLESSLLKQSDYVYAYILDKGNRRWLNALEYRKKQFQDWLTHAEKTTHSSTESDILSRLEEEYGKFDAKRNEVVAVFDKGDVEKSKRLLIEDVNPLRDQVYALCEDFIEINEQYIDASTTHADSLTSALMWIVAVCVGMTILSGGGLFWLFMQGVHLPLKKIVADVREFADSGRPNMDFSTADEFRAISSYLHTLMSDVTTIRSALRISRQKVLNAEKLASVGKLAASVAHEIRNPLIAVKMWLTSIQKSRRDDQELCRNLEMLSGEISRLESIVRDFLEFSRPPVLQLEPTPLAPLLDETMELVSCRCTENRINLLRECAGWLPPFRADRKQLKQMFINLFNNALEAMPEGGEIRVVTDSTAVYDGRQMVVVRVQDTGSGMPGEVQKRLFEPFFTTKENGTGLGLCIAAGIMNRHAGRLVLESSGKQGTTFTVWIPAAEMDKDAAAQPPPLKIKTKGQ